MPDDNVVQVGEKGDPPVPQAVERPREDLRKNIRSDIEAEGKGVKKVQLAQVREGQVTVEIGPHWDMGICLGDVECGEEGRRRKEARQYPVIVKSERGSEDVLVDGEVCCRGEGLRTDGRENKAEAEQERPHPCGPNRGWGPEGQVGAGWMRGDKEAGDPRPRTNESPDGPSWREVEEPLSIWQRIGQVARRS